MFTKLLITLLLVNVLKNKYIKTLANIDQTIYNNLEYLNGILSICEEIKTENSKKYQQFIMNEINNLDQDKLNNNEYKYIFICNKYIITKDSNNFLLNFTTPIILDKNYNSFQNKFFLNNDAYELYYTYTPQSHYIKLFKNNNIIYNFNLN